MPHPEYLFYAVVVLIGIPSVPFNRVALVAVAAWAFGQWAYLFGVHDPRADLIADTVGLVFALAFSLAQFRPSNMLAALIFIPLIGVEIADLKHFLHPFYCYWLSYGCALLQMLALPGGNDWQRARKTWECYKRSSTVEWFIRVAARRYAL